MAGKSGGKIKQSRETREKSANRRVLNLFFLVWRLEKKGRSIDSRLEVNAGEKRRKNKESIPPAPRGASS
jgi:hypothetical protein